MYHENATAKELEEYAKSYVALQTKVMRILADSVLLEDLESRVNETKSPIPLNVRVAAIRVYNFEIDLATVIRSFSAGVDTDDVDPNYQTFPKSENKTAERIPLTVLDNEYGFINWTRTFSLLPGPPNVTHVYVQDVSYLEALKELFSRHSKETIDNYLCWSFAERLLPYSTRKMKKAYEDFKRSIPDSSNSLGSTGSSSSDGKAGLARWKECVHVTCQELKLPTSLLYYLEKEDQVEKVKKRATDIIVKIKEAFSSVMEGQSWIKSQEIRKLLQQRIYSIESRVALPDYILSNSSVIDDLYSGLEVSTSTVFLNNVINITRHEVLLDLQKLNQKPEPEKDWLMQPLVSNAYFDALNDNISECSHHLCL